MLSSVLNSEKAILVNIQIMRTFTKLRKMIENNQDLRTKIEEMEKKYDTQFKIIFESIKHLIEPNIKPKRKMGFYVADEKIKGLKSSKGIKFYNDCSFAYFFLALIPHYSALNSGSSRQH